MGLIWLRLGDFRTEGGTGKAGDGGQNESEDDVLHSLLRGNEIRFQL